MEHSPPENWPENWYIVQSASGQCEILCLSTGESLAEDVLKDSLQGSSEDSASSDNSSSKGDLKQWGPFKTQSQAIAKRVGLIRAGKCKPS